MLTYEECVSYADLTPDEVAAIAEHEHVPDMVACELGDNLVRNHDGLCQIRRFMEEDIAHAQSIRHFAHARHLSRVLDNFASHHPMN